MTDQEKEELKKWAIENFQGIGGILSEEWWADFFIGAGLHGFATGNYTVTTDEK